MRSASEADWVCVLDTGSTDDTVALLRAHGAIVEQKRIEPWRFDDARNESMKLIPPEADVCCCVDLDEQFRPGWRAALEAAWKPDTTRARYRYTWSFNPDGSEGVVFYPEKFHKNGCYRWKHPVHEILEYVGEGAERVVTARGVQLDHHPDAAKSRAQYLPLLELAVAEAPEDDRCRHYLGREYLYRGEWQKAIDTLRAHLALPSATWADERAASMRFIARCYRHLGRDDLAAAWYHRAIAEAPHLREPYVDYASLLYDHGNWEGVAYFARCALAVTERGATYITEGYAWGALPWDYLAIAEWNLGRADEAAEACRRAVALAPEEERLQNNLAIFERALYNKKQEQLL
ncbi:MAG: tetratricopeptide repeat protein [Oscillospiraceae bacterium]|nr:tetratricopeptide repeat protein [Oscillospiraceae bacterium]